jgi:LmbE family N-acetylglucosaminyl deacetylase
MSDRPPRLLVIAPHPDDEILGAGGTIVRFSRAGGEVTVLTVTGDLPPVYPPGVWEDNVAEARLAHAVVGVKESIFMDNPAVMLGEIPVPELNDKILKVLEQVDPDILFVPYYDRHIDHRHVFEATMVATRPVGVGQRLRLLAAYETLSGTHWNAPHMEPNFSPNWSVDITEQIDTKLEAMRCYQRDLQRFPRPRSLEALRALALFRGSQAGTAFAEAFYIIRMTAAPETLV